MAGFLSKRRRTSLDFLLAFQERIYRTVVRGLFGNPTCKLVLMNLVDTAKCIEYFVLAIG
jgi:hypothetical protein